MWFVSLHSFYTPSRQPRSSAGTRVFRTRVRPHSTHYPPSPPTNPKIEGAHKTTVIALSKMFYFELDR